MSPFAAELSLEACLEWHRRRGLVAALVAVDEVDSTNRLARDVATAYSCEGRPVPRTVLLARGQSAGRGRQGRSWASPAGQGIYTSLLVPLPDAAALAALPLSVPVALCGSLDRLGLDCGIKWPNDLMVGGLKLGGVLIESLGGRAVIIGYGINGGQNAAELPVPGSTSLRLALGEPPELSRLAVELAAAVLERLDRRETAPRVVAAYRRRSVHRTGDAMRCRVGDEEIEGRFAGIAPCGSLRLVTACGERLLGSAELLTGGGGDAEQEVRR